MSTTTIRMDEALKVRITAAAERAGKTPHAFMVEAITEYVEQDEEDAAFHRLGLERLEEMQRTGMAVAWEDVKQWLQATAKGERPEWPKARKIDGLAARDED
jgi:predicted transcriptional regulator